MLVLSRKPGEKIVIRDKATGVVLLSVTAMRLGPCSVRIGIQAPEEWEILREELTLDPTLEPRPAVAPAT